MKVRTSLRWSAATLLVAVVGIAFVLLYGYTESEARRIAPLAFSEAVSNEGLREADYFAPTYELRPGIGWDAKYQPKNGNALIVVSICDRDREIKVFQRNENGSYRVLRTSL
jgi:hypothetical protein